MKNLTLVFVFVTIFCGLSRANNIEVKNIGITGQNVAQHFSLVKFDLSWENSWRLSVGPSNWDAAWVFIKFRVNGGDWAHAKLNYVNGTADGHIVPTGATIRTSNDGLSYGLGAFIYRSADGSGVVNYQNVQLRWNYGENGVGDGDLVDVQVFALEMVYIPQGAFDLGGVYGSEYYYFYSFPTQASIYKISSENAITVGNVSGNLYYGAGGGDRLGPIPATFPKGYKAFYCMKFEMSQDQWVSFFNTLTDLQKTNSNITDVNHKNSDAVVSRNAVSWNGSGDAKTSLLMYLLHIY